MMFRVHKTFAGEAEIIADDIEDAIKQADEMDVTDFIRIYEVDSLLVDLDE